MSRGFLHLPKDVLRLIFLQYCDPLMAVRCSRVCRKFRKAIGNTNKLAHEALVFRLREEQRNMQEMVVLHQQLAPMLNKRRLGLEKARPYVKTKCHSCSLIYCHIFGTLGHSPDDCPMRTVLCKDCGTNMPQAKYKYQHPSTCPKKMTNATKERMVLLYVLVGIVECVRQCVEICRPKTFSGMLGRLLLLLVIIRIMY